MQTPAVHLALSVIEYLERAHLPAIAFGFLDDDPSIRKALDRLLKTAGI